MATSDTTYQSHVVSEHLGTVKHHCSKIRKIQSRGVFLVLLWTFAIRAVSYTVFRLAVGIHWFPNGMYAHGIIATMQVVLCCPFAGWLADVYFGRYKILRVSLLFMWISTAGLALLYTLFININIPSAVMTTASTLIALPMGFSYAAFLANSIPFAMDQIPTASGEQVSALINWYAWASFLGKAVAQLGVIAHSDKHQKDTVVYVLIALLTILTIAISCGMIFHNIFIIEPQSRNPWKIVFNVLKYAAIHKHPENRSALTYCEDPPSRLDLGKNRYGGPYTTEEVEDVKTFLRTMAVILCISISTIAIFFCDNSKNSIFRMLKGVGNSKSYSYNAIQFSYSENVLVVLYIPLYELVIYPFLRNRVPSMLQRIVISAFGVIIMSIYLLTIDIAGHYSSGHNITCIFNETQNENIEMLPVNFAVLSVPFHILLSCVILLHEVSLFQFICAQAPYSMKGLLVGFGFLVKYFSLCIATLVQGGFRKILEHRDEKSLTASCDFWFFITTLLMSIAGMVIISLVAKWYKKREREDPNNDRMFVEAYYERYCVNSPSLEEISVDNT